MRNSPIKLGIWKHWNNESHTYTDAHICIHIQCAQRVYVYIYTYVLIYIMSYTDIYIYIYMCVCVMLVYRHVYIYSYTYTGIYIYIIYIEFLEVLNRNSSTNTSTNQQLHQTPRHLAWAVPRSRAPQALPAESPKQRRGEQATNEAGAGTAKGGWIMILTTIPKRNGGLPHQVSSIGWVAGNTEDHHLPNHLAVLWRLPARFLWNFRDINVVNPNGGVSAKECCKHLPETLIERLICPFLLWFRRVH